MTPSRKFDPHPDDAEVERLRRKHLEPALRHFLRSRDLCPLRAGAQMAIAANENYLTEADALGTYLERAKLLAPDDPGLWYRCGVYEFADGQDDQAWASWRRSLELSDERLSAILAQVTKLLAPSEILDRVLPDRPALLIEAAKRLFPTQDKGRRPFEERALAVLEGRRVPLAAEDLHLRATLYRSLGRPSEALAAYRAALIQEPLRLDWRQERAQLAYELGQYEESRQELLAILGLQPGDPGARELMDTVTRKIAAGP